MRSKASFRGHPSHPALIPFPRWIRGDATVQPDALLLGAEGLAVRHRSRDSACGAVADQPSVSAPLNQPPRNPARRSPVRMNSDLLSSRHTSPERKFSSITTTGPWSSA
ncbi:hypothetical protein BH23GEM2_BH23GEM2_16020 [soil metagenome]